MDIEKWAYIARSECQTISDYLPFLKIDPDTQLLAINENDKLLEIMGDEMNHCLVALFSLATILGISIPMDSFPSDLPLKWE